MNLLLGAIAGDIIGSPYKGSGKPSLPITDFDAGSRFTDDTVMVVAIADAIMNDLSHTDALQKWGQNTADSIMDECSKVGYGLLIQNPTAAMAMDLQ